RAPARGRRVLARRPRLDERPRREREAHAAGEARRRRPRHDRDDRAPLQPRRAVIVESVAVEEVLLLLKIVFLVVLYLFIWRIVRSATRDLRLPQESFVLAPESGAVARASGPTGRLVVVKSPALDAGSDVVLNSAPLTVG